VDNLANGERNNYFLYYMRHMSRWMESECYGSFQKNAESAWTLFLFNCKTNNQEWLNVLLINCVG